MKKFLIQTLLLLGLITVMVFLFATGPQLSGLPFVPQQTITRELQINDHKIRVEVADNPQKRAKGLGDRESLGQDEGMLFIFSKRDKYPFWMKGLKFPLDFIWITDNKIVDMLVNVPPPSPGQQDSSLPIYQSSEEVDQVLEVPAGTIQRLNIKVGDSIKLVQ